VLGRFLAGSTAHGVSLPCAAAREVTQDSVGARAADLAVAAGVVAPVMFLPPASRAGPPAPLADACGEPVALTAAAHTSGATFLPRHRPVAVGLGRVAREAVLLPAGAGGAGADCVIPSGAWRRVPPLGAPPARWLRVRAGGPLYSQRRARTPWEAVGRDRLLQAWKAVLRDHVLPADDVRLVGLFGPAPLGAVESVALDPSGEVAIVALRPTRVPGPPGDIALARHVPTGRLLTVLLHSERGSRH